MVEQDFDPSKPVDLVLEDAIAKITELFNKGEKHRDVGELLLQLEASVKAGKVAKKDGNKVGEDSQEFKDFMDSDLARNELFAIRNADEFYDTIEEMEYMEEFKHQDLIDNQWKIYHKIGDGKGKMIMINEFPSPLYVLSSLFVETDLIHHWMEGAKAGGDDGSNLEIYDKPTDLISAMHLDMKVPTQGNYHMDITSTTYLDRKTNGILNVGFSCDPDRKWFGQELKKPKEADSKVMKVDRMFRYVEKIDENKCKHMMVSEFPLAEGMTKEVIIEHMLKGRGVARMKAMMDAYDKTISHYEERVHGSKKEFYDKIKKIFEDDE